MKKAHMTDKRKYLISAILFVAAIAMILAAVAINNIRPPEIETEIDFEKGLGSTEVSAIGGERRDGVFSVLVVGIDAVSNSTDTIMLASFDTELSKMSVMSIPRDTITNTKRANKKINASYIINKHAKYNDISVSSCT